MKVITLTLSLFAFAGCVSRVTVSSKFDVAEARKLMAPGKNTVTGTAAVTRAGSVGSVTCSGTPVYAIPSTAYARERMLAVYQSKDSGFRSAREYRLEETDKDSRAYDDTHWITMCGPKGEFVFDSLPDGEFFIETAIRWKIAEFHQQGGTLMKRVLVKGGETKQVALSGESR